MNPIKPKYEGTVKVQWSISKKSKEIISLYSKYTRYDESEIVDKLIEDILEDKNFEVWIKNRRFKAKADRLIFGNDIAIGGDDSEEDETISNLQE